MEIPFLDGRATTGIRGLDEILHGGLPRDRTYLVEGAPGSGKTTFGLHFLLEGLSRGEPGMIVVHSETEDEVRQIARSHGFDLGELVIHEWKEAKAQAAEPYTLFHAAEIELGEWMGDLLDEVDRLRPKRLVFDAVSGLRMLSTDEAFFRRQLQALREFLIDRGCTTLLLDDLPERDRRAETMAHGVLVLENILQEFGPERRRLRVLKMRGMSYADGYHDFVIRQGGLEVYPRLVARRRAAPADPTKCIESGVEALDRLLGGGLPRGASSLFIGPAGVGKSTLAATFAVEAARRDERCSVMLFDETETTWSARLKALGVDPTPHLKDGTILLCRLDPAQLSPGALADSMRRDVADGASIVVLDSLNGYLQAMSEERFVEMHLRELLTFLNEQGVTTLLTLAQHGMVGAPMESTMDLSYLADVVVLLRYFEAQGAIRQAISVVKKRTGAHERAIRELSFDGGVRVGEPLREFSGILSGAPRFDGKPGTLFDLREG